MSSYQIRSPREAATRAAVMFALLLADGTDPQEAMRTVLADLRFYTHQDTVGFALDDAAEEYFRHRPHRDLPRQVEDCAEDVV